MNTRRRVIAFAQTSEHLYELILPADDQEHSPLDLFCTVDGVLQAWTNPVSGEEQGFGGTIAERQGELTSLQEERQAAEDEVKRLEAEAKAEAERVAAEEEARKAAEAAQAEADRIAAAQAEAQRLAAAQAEANRRAQQQQYVAPPQQQYAPPAQGNPTGYTGPRCYAPGGKTWRPC